MEIEKFEWKPFYIFYVCGNVINIKASPLRTHRRMLKIFNETS